MICILLSSYNGEKYIKELLDSLYSQTNKNFRIIVRDDMSTDSTLSILSSYDLEIISDNKKLGAKRSFSTLLEYAVANTDCQYFMFCDQDDVWEKDKLNKTLTKMQNIEKVNVKTPILVHTNLKVVDENLNIINDSFMLYQGLKTKPYSFNDLIIQNNITGCTVMINRYLAKISLPIPEESIMHDWWIGLVASKFGKIGYLNHSTVMYRQHAKNTIGASVYNLEYVLSNLIKKQSILKYIVQAKSFLYIYRGKLDVKTIEVLEEFISIETKSFFQKRKLLLKYKLYMHGRIRNIGLFLKI
jgi:glycosyltransferase involved in cell wall biosynthesis